MNYSSFVGIREGYQASINLDFDLNKIDKIKAYIPTEKSVMVLGDLLRTFYYSTDPQGRATVLVGAYGRGKSHLLLVLSALTSLDLYCGKKAYKEECVKALNELCEKITGVNAEVGSLASTIVNSNIRTLPVIINSNSGDINQSFLYSISKALEKANLKKLLPETYFDSAIKMIKKWEKSFPEAYNQFCLELKKHKTSAESVLVGLKSYDRLNYDLFCSVYPCIAAGTEFNPLSNMDVVKLYIDIAAALKEQTDYCGLNIIFDEFSKFLETNTENANMLNMKIIQDMAEAATRSGDSQIHFTCVTHKDILDYSSSDSFKTVEGRFRNIRFITSSKQSYELISNAISKNDNYFEFKNNHDLEFKRVCECYSEVNCFTEFDYSDFEKRIVDGCFPLSPLGVYSLLRISEIVGQNERTLFTFLSQNEPNTIKSFISDDRNSCEFVTVDCIYNYFEDLFEKELFNPRIYDIWSTANTAIKKAKDDVQVRIIKSIALINMISDDRLKAIPVHLKSCLLIDNRKFEVAINDLLKQQIVMQRDNLEFILLTDDTISVKSKIENYVNNELASVNVCKILSESYGLGYVFPREYNDEYCMLRYFKNIFMEAGALVKYKNAKQLFLDYPYDGIIINIVDYDASYKEKLIKFIKKLKNNPQIIICVSKQPFVYLDLLKKSAAISTLKKLNEKDIDTLKELEAFEEDNDFRISRALDVLFSPKSSNSDFYNCNGRLDIVNHISLSKETSRICCNVYCYTPRINNEMVNKKHLNTQNKKARNKVVEWLLANSETNAIPCLDGYSPEASIYKSVFKYTGLDKTYEVSDQGINRVIKEIKKFVTGCENKRDSFSSLYQTLESAPYSIRKGIIPLFIVYVFRQYKNSIVLYYREKEVELSDAILNNINDDPNNYSMLIETGTKEKEEYLDALESLFVDFADQDSTSVNKMYSVVKAMQNWVRSLPEYTKKYKEYLDGAEIAKIDSKIDFVRRELLRYEINPRELLFESFINGIEVGNYNDSLSFLELTKNTLDSHIKNTKRGLLQIIVKFFNSNENSSLSSAIISWYRQLPDSTKTHMFDAKSNQLLSIAKNNNSYDDDRLFDTIVDEFVGLSIVDWNDSALLDFMDSLKNSISSISEYKEKNDSTNRFKLSIQLDDGIHEKVYSSNDISLLGETALNNIRAIFEEYNEALEPDEKLAIITKLLEDIIH